jgi:hypothetical protein
VSLTLTDRVPVSDDRDVEVDRIRLNPDVVPDDDGLVHWDVVLAPRETRIFEIEYRIEYPSDWLSRARQSRQPAASSLYQQIEDLEVLMK